MNKLAYTCIDTISRLLNRGQTSMVSQLFTAADSNDDDGNDADDDTQ